MFYVKALLPFTATIDLNIWGWVRLILKIPCQFEFPIAIRGGILFPDIPQRRNVDTRRDSEMEGEWS